LDGAGGVYFPVASQPQDRLRFCSNIFARLGFCKRAGQNLASGSAAMP